MQTTKIYLLMPDDNVEGSDIVTNCYFENLENIVISNLARTGKNVRIAVAWINFDIYGMVINSLIDKGVQVKILLHDDFSNHRYDSIINQMTIKGAEIRFVDFRGIMHHKFCIIDEKLCLFGSFNWTKNANTRNIEDLNICDELQLIYNYKTEFKALWELSKSDITLLRNPERCKECGDPLVNVLLMEQEGYNQTEIPATGHNYKTVTETVHHPAEYETRPVCVFSDGYKCYTDEEAGAHQRYLAELELSTGQYVDGGYTNTIEQVLVKEAWDEQVSHQKCSVCGATK